MVNFPQTGCMGTVYSPLVCICRPQRVRWVFSRFITTTGVNLNHHSLKQGIVFKETRAQKPLVFLVQKASGEREVKKDVIRAKFSFFYFNRNYFHWTYHLFHVTHEHYVRHYFMQMKRWRSSLVPCLDSENWPPKYAGRRKLNGKKQQKNLFKDWQQHEQETCWTWQETCSRISKTVLL